MRLINVNTRALEEFVSNARGVPPYAILSHTWGPDHEEISFQDVRKGVTKTGSGRYKFDKCCSQALRDGLSYVWIDSCCIDKTSSTELSEAINSMFKWYKNAQICYAYLCDVNAGEDPLAPQSSFRESRWFRRGWTLQELIAPKKLSFYDTSWSRCHAIETSRDELLNTAETLHDRFNEQFTADTVLDDRIEEWSALTIESLPETINVNDVEHDVALERTLLVPDLGRGFLALLL